MNRIHFIPSLLVGLWGTLPASATVLLSTLDQPFAGRGLSFFDSGYEFASDFKTGDQPTMARGLIIQIANLDGTGEIPPSPRPHVMQALVYASSNGQPGALVAAFDEFGVCQPRSTFTTFSDAGIPLTANTEYWLSVRIVTSPTVPLAVSPFSTETDEVSAESSFSSVAGTPLAFRPSSEADWTTLTIPGTSLPRPGNLMLAVLDQPIPEPAASVSAVLGLLAYALRRRRPDVAH